LRFLAVMVYFDLIRADVLGDAAKLAADHIGLADGVQQRRLTVIDVAHDGHNGWARLQCPGRRLMFGRDDGRDDRLRLGLRPQGVAVGGGQTVCQGFVQPLVRRDQLAELHQLFDGRVRLDADGCRDLFDGRVGGDLGDLACGSRLAQNFAHGVGRFYIDDRARPADLHAQIIQCHGQLGAGHLQFIG
jgi:hypothetical protein